MAEISITVGTLTVTMGAEDAKAQEVLEQVYEHLARAEADDGVGGQPPQRTAKEKLRYVLSHTVREWVRIAADAERRAEHEAYMQKLQTIQAASKVKVEEWSERTVEAKL